VQLLVRDLGEEELGELWSIGPRRLGGVCEVLDYCTELPGKIFVEAVY
jgi:hypothetical protein